MAADRPLPEPLYFASPAAFRLWFEQHASAQTELLVGFHKVDSGIASITWPQAVDEALCAGWIDGVRKRIDEHRYQIRFTPRKTTSIWSAINIGRMQVLMDAGRVMPAGLAAFERRTEGKSKIYAYEQAEVATLTADEKKTFRKHKAAWAYFEKQPPGYRRTALWRIVSVKQAATRARRLAVLIDACAEGRRIL